jgi:hypothetical protein
MMQVANRDLFLRGKNKEKGDGQSPLFLTRSAKALLKEVREDVEQISQKPEGFHADRVDDRGGDHRNSGGFSYSSIHEGNHQGQTI